MLTKILDKLFDGFLFGIGFFLAYWLADKIGIL